MALHPGRTKPPDLPLPELDAARCVHSHLEQASCHACVDRCPNGAWLLDDERLGLDSTRCDGCGLCAPACPEEAIAETFVPVHYELEGRGNAFAACVLAGVRTDRGTAPEGLLPCLHVLGVRILLRLHQAGVRRLMLCSGDCDCCPRGRVTRIESSLAQVEALLRDRGLDPLEVIALEPKAWVVRLEAARERHQPSALGRRSFLRGVLSAATETASELAEGIGRRRPASTPPGRLVPRPAGSGLRLHAPRIQAERCTGCDACVRLCPHEVIRVEAQAYRFAPDDCTGCGICTDVCASSAISIRRLDPSPPNRVQLYPGRCAACGIAFHLPRPRSGSARDLCPICARTNHHQRLFQRFS